MSVFPKEIPPEYLAMIKREWLNRFKIQSYAHAYRLVFDISRHYITQKRLTAAAITFHLMNMRRHTKEATTVIQIQQNFSF